MILHNKGNIMKTLSKLLILLLVLVSCSQKEEEEELPRVDVLVQLLLTI